MKTLVSAAALSLALSAPAFAGGFAAEVVEPVIVAPAAPSVHRTKGRGIARCRALSTSGPESRAPRSDAGLHARPLTGCRAPRDLRSSVTRKEFK